MDREQETVARNESVAGAYYYLENDLMDLYRMSRILEIVSDLALSEEASMSDDRTHTIIRSENRDAIVYAAAHLKFMARAVVKKYEHGYRGRGTSN
ncbi:MAG: hypothetical protein ACJ8DL_12830 [Microvirga sp.]